MHFPTARPLTERILIENFLKFALQDERFRDYDLIGKICSCELELANYGNDAPTIDFEKNRHYDYRADAVRWQLRRKIVDELFTMKMPKHEAEIRLGNGGALPDCELQKKRKAFILIGPPASGKSGVASTIANNWGAVILDSDIAKRKIPEFKSNFAGATLVHNESSAIIWGETKWGIDFTPLVKKCTDEGINVVIPKIGDDFISIENLAKTLQNNLNYEVHLTLISLDRSLATKRALDRFIDNERYVPLGLIFDVYGNEPILSYYRLKDRRGDHIKSFGKLSADVKQGSPLKVIYQEAGNPAELFNHKKL